MGSVSYLCYFLGLLYKNTKLGGLNKRNVLIHSSGGQMSESKVLIVLVPFEAFGEGLLHVYLLGFGGLLVAFGIPWLVRLP